MNTLNRLKSGLLGAVLLATAGTAHAQGMKDVSIALGSVGFGTAPVRIAKEMGLYEKHGLNARIITMESSNASMTALLSRSVEIALSGSGEIIAAQGRGQKVVVIANTYSGLSGSLVLSKTVADKLGVSPAAPVAERLKALNGLVIASTTATSVYTVALKGATAAVGATPRLTFMSPPTMAGALESGAIQGYIAGAPSWAPPVVKGSGVVWISGPKAELAAENSPASSASLQALREVAEANPELMKRLATVNDDLAKAIDERPAEVKAAIARAYPDLDAKTLDLLFTSESAAWKAKPLTIEDMKHEITFIKSSGMALPMIDSADPASMLFQ